MLLSLSDCTTNLRCVPSLSVELFVLNARALLELLSYGWSPYPGIFRRKVQVAKYCRESLARSPGLESCRGASLKTPIRPEKRAGAL